jgi:hypothetical protein
MGKYWPVKTVDVTMPTERLLCEEIEVLEPHRKVLAEAQAEGLIGLHPQEDRWVVTEKGQRALSECAAAKLEEISDPNGAVWAAMGGTLGAAWAKG